MKDYTKNRLNGPRQQEVVLRCLPYGIYAEKLMIGNTASETRSIQAAYHILAEKELFEKVPIENKGVLKRVKRDIFRNERVDTVLQKTLPDNILKNVSFDQTISVRGSSYYNEKFSRLTRYSDVQNFLYSCKVDTPLTVLAYHQANPFIFGEPKTIDEDDSADKNRSLLSIITNAMNEDGVREIDALLTLGLEGFIKTYDDKVLNSIGLNITKYGNLFADDNGYQYYNGTYTNIQALNSKKKIQETLRNDEQHTFLFCHEDQADFYSDIIGIDKKLIVVV